MISTAFVSAIPVLAKTAPSVLVTSFTARAKVQIPKRHRTQAVVMVKEEKQRVEGMFGFTSFAENANGRAAMMGFVLAVMTELLTGHSLLSQIFTMINNAKGGSPVDVM